MSYVVVNLPALIATSSGSSVTNGIGSLDDADSIVLFMVSTANAGSSGAAGLLLQVSQFDPAVVDPTGVTQSTGWNTVSTSIFPVNTSSAAAHFVTGGGFRGLRLSGLTSAGPGDVIARVAKQILVD